VTTKRLLAALAPALILACAQSRQISAADATLACTSCHGDPARPGGALDKAAPATGAHLAHLGQGVACGACHVVPTSTSHSNGVVEVRFAGIALSGGATPSYANGTCSGVYCHGATLNAGGKISTPSWSGGPLACDACHGAPPPSHASSSTSCTTCHPGTVNPDGTINVAGGLHVDGIVEGGGGHPQGWSDPAQHGQAALNGLASCKSCHGADLAGGTAGVSCNACHAANGYANWQTNCTFCHGQKVATYDPASLVSAAPPRGTKGEVATTDLAVGAHRRHLTGGAIGPAVACSTCHVVPTDLSHVGGSASVTFSGPALRSGAAPIWNGAGCSATYCHGATLGAGGSNQAPSWTGGSGQAACGTCHGIPPPAPHSTSTTCGTCHSGYTSTSVNPALHMNGTVESTSPHPTGWAAKEQHGYSANHGGLSSCTSCHGTDFAGGTVGVSCNACHTSAGWTAWQTNCTFCHGTRVAAYTSANLVSAAPPVGSEGETLTTDRAVGAHQAHLTAGPLGAALACTDCHTVPADLSHVNGTATVTFGAGATRGGAAPVWNGATCASTYCHGSTLAAGGTNQAPSWTGGSAQAACGTCHGIPPPAPHTTATTCGDCHTGYTSTTVNVALHLNGTIDATSSHPAGWAAKEQHGYSANKSGFTTCKSCHGTNLDGVGGTGPSCTACHSSAGFPTWNTNCTFCHGDRTSGLASPPLDTQGLSSTANVSVGAHAVHLGTSLMTTPACTACHPDRTGSNVITDTTHVDGNGVAEVTLGTLAKTGGAAATYSRTSATAASCNAVYCHGAFTGATGGNVSWVSPPVATCTSCHGLPPSTGHHGNHSSRSCGDCHPGYTRTTVNQASHINGTKEVGNNITSWNPTTRQCVGCHGSATW